MRTDHCYGKLSPGFSSELGQVTRALEGMRMAAPPTHLQFEVSTTLHHSRTVAVVRVHGEIDMTTCDDLAEALAQELGAVPHPAEVILDMTAVDFIDSSGLAVLLQAHQRATQAQSRLRIVTDRHAVRRLLDVSGVADLFELHPTMSHALGDVLAD